MGSLGAGQVSKNDFNPIPNVDNISQQQQQRRMREQPWKALALDFSSALAT